MVSYPLPSLPGPCPLPAIPPWCLLVSISTSCLLCPTPGYVRGLRTHRGALLSNQIHTEPESANAAVPHSLCLGRVETPGRKPFHLGRQGTNTGPRAPRQLNGWPRISHHFVGPQQGTNWPLRQNKATVQSQSHKDHRDASSGPGAGNTVPGPRGGNGSVQVYPMFCPHTHASPYTLSHI